MNPLQILIHKSGYSIYNGVLERNLVSNIQRMDDALEIFHELSSSMAFPPNYNQGDWMVVPGALISE